MKVVDKWIIGVIVYVFLMYVFAVQVFEEDFLAKFTPLMLISALAITTSLTVNLVFHYRKKSRRFTVSYAFLSIAFGAYTVAELLYAMLDLSGFDPYPSLAEPFYGIYFVASILFCLTLFWCRRNLVETRVVLIGAAAGLTCFFTYLVLSLPYIESDYFWTSTIIMALSSVLLGSSIMTSITVWKAPQLRKVWLVIGLALFCNAIADIIYYSNINNEQFLYSDVSNWIWFGTVLMIFYALYIHRFLYIGKNY